MSPVNQSAVAEFLKSGGRISQLKESIQASEAEVLDYLASCGITAKYSPGDYRAYLCQGRRVSESKLFAIANEQRRSHELAPFSPKVAIRYTSPKSALSS